MKTRLIAFIHLAAMSFLSAESAISPTSVFTLVQSGAPACVIVIAERPSPAARLAAYELQHHLFKSTGVDVPIRADSERVEGLRMLVGESAATRQLDIRGLDFKPQEYLVAFRSNAIVLIGRDWTDSEANRRVSGRSTTDETLQQLRHRIDYWKTVGRPDRGGGELELPGIYDDQGTCLAVYDFLERYCGVRWYGPSETSIIVPSRTNLAVAGSDIRRSPALKHRSALCSGSWPFLRGQWGEFSREQLYLFWRRLRQGGERWAGNHTFHRSTIQTLFTDPDYQCQNPKGLGSQLCYTNPKLVQQVAGMARSYFDGQGELPAGWKAMGDYFAMVPDDNINLCTCTNCQALLQRGRTNKTGFFSSGEMSDYWFNFVNAVAREVRKTHPDKYIATLAYWSYAFPPGFELEPNISIAPCLHTCYYPVHVEMRENDLKLYHAWQQQVKTPMFLWVYYHHPMEAALIGKWKCFPHVMVHDSARSMQKFIRDGVRGIFECGEQDQLEQYVIAKVWDNPDVNVDAMMDEFFRLYFGAAGEPMKQFYTRLEQTACDLANYPPPYHRRDGINWKTVAWERLGTTERMSELGGMISKAERLAQSKAEKQRVALWRDAIWEWMRQGLEQSQSTPRPD
jgi:hypothetical protein